MDLYCGYFVAHDLSPSRFGTLHDCLDRNRFKDKIMQPLNVLQRPLRVSEDGPRCQFRMTRTVA